MADEEVENLPPQEGEEAPKKGGSPLVPVLIMVIMIPGLSFVTTNFLLIPSMKKAVQEAVVQVQEAGGPGKMSAGNESGPVQTYEFEDIVANIAGALHSRYVKVSFTVEGTAGDFVERVESNKARLIDASLGALSSLNIMDLEKPGIKNILRNDLLSAFEVALNEELIEQLYFSEFVVQ